MFGFGRVQTVHSTVTEWLGSQEEEKARSLESMEEKKKSTQWQNERREATIISRKLPTNLKDHLMCERCHLR